MTAESFTGARGRPGARDVMVTGMGFCLPGKEGPVRTKEDLWDIAASGDCCLTHDGIYHGTVGLSDAEFASCIPGIPGAFSQYFTAVHRFGLVSLAEAAADAALDIRAGHLAEAAILAGRGSVDANVDSYLAALRGDPGTLSPLEAIDVYVGIGQAASPSDVALVQAALTRSTGPCFTVSCGCASSAVQVGNAAAMIASGAADIAVVTGVDVFNASLVRRTQQVLWMIEQSAGPVPAAGTGTALPSFDRLMRPYDQRAGSANFGEGSATLILESRAHADRRSAPCYGQILAHGMARDGMAHPLASDPAGPGLMAAVRRCLGERWDIRQVPYIHGSNDGGEAVVTAAECAAVRELYGLAASELLMTSQEACFGHLGAPGGSLGVALILLMMQRGAVCPTANCEQPEEGLPFDPVPGTKARPLDFTRALHLSYQIGGVKDALLVGTPDST